MFTHSLYLILILHKHGISASHYLIGCKLILNCMKVLLHVDGAMFDAWYKACTNVWHYSILLFPLPPTPSCLFRHKKYKERKEKYSPSDAAAANNGESRDAIEMDTLPNTAALQREKENPTSPVATAGPSTTTGATTTTASSIATEATAATGPGATGVTTRPAVDPFDLSEDQIKSRRGLFSFSRVTGSFNRGRKK